MSRVPLRVRRLTGRLAVGVCAALLLAGCSNSQGTSAGVNGGEYRFVQAQPQGKVIARPDRSKIPPINGNLLDGSKFRLDSWRGSIVVINFWGSWCAPCRVESPELQQLYQQYRTDGVRMLGVNVKDSLDLAESFVAAKGLTYPSIFDPRGEVALALRDFPASAIPTSLVLDREGKVAATYVGRVQKAALATTLARLAKEH